MSNLTCTTILAALLLLVTLSSAAEPKSCNDGESLVAFAICTPKVKELNRYLGIYKGRKPPTETYKNMSMLCESATKCLGVLDCKEAKEANALFHDACAQLNILAADVHTCLPKFFQAVYDKKGCAKDQDYFSKDLTKKRAAYTTGKQCLLDFANENCSEETNTFLKDDSKYKKFLDIITIPPNLGTCQGFHYQLEGFQCKPVLTDIDTLGKAINMETFQRNDAEITKVIKTCRAAEKCATDACSLGPTFLNIAKGCDAFELANTGYVMCARKIKQEKPDLSKYKCFKGSDMTDKSKKASCVRLTEKKDCVKQIMEDVCGKEGVEDYEKNLESMKKIFQC